MLPFRVTIPVTVPQRSEIPEGLTNNPVYICILIDGLTLQQVNMWSLEDTCFHHLCLLVGVYCKKGLLKVSSLGW